MSRGLCVNPALTGPSALCSGPESSPLNEVVSEAFVRFFVEIVGHYSLFLTAGEREERTLQREAFRKAVSSKSLRRFLEVFMETQTFRGFIQERELRRQDARGEEAPSTWGPRQLGTPRPRGQMSKKEGHGASALVGPVRLPALENAPSCHLGAEPAAPVSCLSSRAISVPSHSLSQNHSPGSGGKFSFCSIFPT